MAGLMYSVLLHCDFHVVWRSGWRLALLLAPKAGATPNNGILSDIGGNVAPERPHFPLRSRFTLGTPDSPSAHSRLPEIETVPLLQGLGTALILAIVEQVRDRDEQTRAAASAEVRALQARMNPHFLFNALNTLAALSRVAPREIPRAVGRLRHFLRASFDQHERALAPLEEELTIVNIR